VNCLADLPGLILDAHLSNGGSPLTPCELSSNRSKSNVSASFAIGVPESRHRASNGSKRNCRAATRLGERAVHLAKRWRFIRNPPQWNCISARILFLSNGAKFRKTERDFFE
jgi:hypothetical protein